MNFSLDCTEKKSPPLPRIVPLLVLVKEWSEMGGDAFDQVDVVLLVLQGIRAIGEGKAMPVCDIKQGLEEVSAPLAAKYNESLQNISSDLTLFMDLFDSLSKLTKSSDENVPPFLDSDYKHSVLGVFIRHCVLEYKRLTFSQLLRVHANLHTILQQVTDVPLQIHTPENEHSKLLLHLSEHNFIEALERLRLCLGSIGSSSGEATPQRRELGGDQEIGKEALQLTQLHGQFGHKEEGIFALQEAIRLAQQHNNSLLLEYALAWLHQLQPCSGEDSLIILDKYIKNAVDLKMPSLGIWGRLQQAKAKLELAQEPRNVFDAVMSSEAEFGSVHEIDGKGSRASEQSSILSFLAATWDYYGGKLQGLLYSLLLSHLMSSDHPSPSSGYDDEPLALSLSLVARYLSGMGKFADGVTILKNAKKKLTTKQSSKVLNLCLEELLFDGSVLQEDFTKAEHHLNKITELDHYSAQYRLAVLYKAEGNLHKAKELTRDFLQRLDNSASDDLCKFQYMTRFLILLAEIYSELGLPAMALPHVINSLTVCENNHLPSQQAMLCLAQLQVQMDSPMDCLETVKKCMLHTQCQETSPADSAYNSSTLNDSAIESDVSEERDPTLLDGFDPDGSLLDRGMACFLLVQAKLLSYKDEDNHLHKSDVMDLTLMLTNAIHCFQRISAKGMTRKAMLLQVHLFTFAGDDVERGSLLTQLKKL